MVIFHSYVSLPEGNQEKCWFYEQKSGGFTKKKPRKMVVSRKIDGLSKRN